MICPLLIEINNMCVLKSRFMYWQLNLQSFDFFRHFPISMHRAGETPHLLLQSFVAYQMFPFSSASDIRRHQWVWSNVI